MFSPLYGLVSCLDKQWEQWWNYPCGFLSLPKSGYSCLLTRTPDSFPTKFCVTATIELRVFFSLLFKQSLYCLSQTSKRHSWPSPNLYNPISFTLSLATLKSLFLQHAWFLHLLVFLSVFRVPFAPFPFAQLYLSQAQSSLRCSLRWR